MQVELNIPLPSSAPYEVIRAARALRALGFDAPAARVVTRLATGERMLVLRAEYNTVATGSYSGVNGGVRTLAGVLGVEPISVHMADQPGALWFCRDFADERDRKVDLNFVRWVDVETPPAGVEG